MAWYDLSENKETMREYKARIKYDEIICKKAQSFNQIIDGELKNNIQYRIVTNQSFNAISVIEYLVNYYELSEVYIAVYRMNLQSVNKIKEIINSKNINVVILISSFFRGNKTYEKWAKELIMFSKNHPNASVTFSWNHAKVFLCKTKCNKHIVFEGSGNLSDNARIEQYMIEDNKKTYCFHKKWIDEVKNSKK
jgi:hypothetical protein